MWRVTIEAEGEESVVVEIEEGVHDIGRARGNRIRLTERNVSRSHARLSLRPRGAVIEDLDSQHGTYLNGEVIDREVPLLPADVVQIGAYQIQVQPGAPSEARRDAEGRAQARVVLLEGGTPGAAFPLAGSRVVIGRGEGADIWINDTSVSRAHCELRALPDGRFEARDLDSANGIAHNGKRLKRAIVGPGDVLGLGRVKVRLEAGAPPADRAPPRERQPDADQ